MRTVHVGLGPIGLACLKAALDRTDVTPVGAVDLDPAWNDRSLAAALDLDSSRSIHVSAAWDALPAADVAIVCTTSTLAGIRVVAERALAHRLDVVSTCEPLARPASDDPEARALDEAARAAGRRVLGVGVNPGFVMDALPLAISAAQSRIEAVRVRRIVDVDTRRVQLAQKVGVGLTDVEFAARRERGDIGHVGLPASARLIADGLGWEVDRLVDSLEPVRGVDGRCAGVRQRVRAFQGRRPRITLDLTIASGARPSGDTIWLDGTPPLRWSTRPATHGDEATAATVLNSLPCLPGLAPGLRTMVDLVPFRGRGTHRAVAGPSQD
jgi:4-hydroxy-tetrahydrodipicolinate reductase